ncbi:MAG: thioredoxin family protein [Acidimicrobiales bacterium]|nr:thioredoxin family protein [Acidimicrobiales bacterium]MYG89543.1 thioredoxin family protein [Acidimicrobiales bacterium]MYI27307.1 thioredoxin family protein [Acidimicrobiales bacterium]
MTSSVDRDTPHSEAAGAPPDGLVAVVKRDCPTCELVAPVLADMEARGTLTVFTQDDPSFPESISSRRHDSDLSFSWHHDVETVPTLMRFAGGDEAGRIVGWSRPEWEAFTGLDALGDSLPEHRPGCGSLSVDPSMVDVLEARFGGGLAARRVEFGSLEDVQEAMHDRGWSDGLPLVAPSAERVSAMLAGTSRRPDEVVANVAPDLADCTVEKAAVNAVMAGCRPEYFPAVLAALTAVCNDTFNMHGMLATTMPVGPVFIVNGPIAREIGMNSGINVFGQGNRANSTIGRAVQLIVRNVGGGRPGEVDRAALGQPGKVGFCFAEIEGAAESGWGPLCTDFGFEADTNTVTAFPGEAPRSVVDQLSRDPESLARTMAAALNAIHHPKLVLGFDAILAVAPDHSRVFIDSGWTRQQTAERINELTTRPGSELVRGAGGIAEGVPEFLAEADLPKFREGGLHLVHCGGGAGLFSAVIGGWVNGDVGAQPVCVEIDPWR